MTERGQMRRIEELNQSGPFKGVGFAKAAFGGEARVEQVRQMLRGLRERGVELVVCTKGLVGAVKKCLEDLGLLEFFAEVYGNVGSGYGETLYDREVCRLEPSEEERKLLGCPNQADWSSKDVLISQLKARMNLHRRQVVLVEDDQEEIERAAPICRTLWVRDAAGMTAEHLLALQEMAADTHPRSTRLPETYRSVAMPFKPCSKRAPSRVGASRADDFAECCIAFPGLESMRHEAWPKKCAAEAALRGSSEVTVRPSSRTGSRARVLRSAGSAMLTVSTPP